MFTLYRMPKPIRKRFRRRKQMYPVRYRFRGARAWPLKNFNNSLAMRAMMNNNSVYYFKRDSPAVDIYCSVAGGGGVGTVIADTTNAPGTPPANFTLSAMAADVFANTAQFGIGGLFRLTDVINNAEFTVLFDQYQIAGVKLTFDILSDNTAAAANQFGQIPEMWVVNDYDDSTAPTLLSSIQQYEGCRRFKLEQSRTDKKYIRPRISTLAYKTSGTTIGYAQPASSRSLWIDVNNADVEHYGFKAWVANFPTNTVKATLLRIRATYYLRFKTVR